MIESRILGQAYDRVLAQEGAWLQALGGGGGDPAQPERRVQADSPAPHRRGHGIDELVERHDGAPRDVEGPSDGSRRSQRDFDCAGSVVHIDRLKSRLARRPDVPSSSGALALSLPEAMRLSDALAASLRSRLSLDAGDADLTGRVRQLRAQLERVRDLAATGVDVISVGALTTRAPWIDLSLDLES